VYDRFECDCADVLTLSPRECCVVVELEREPAAEGRTAGSSTGEGVWMRICELCGEEERPPCVEDVWEFWDWEVWEGEGEW